MAIYRDIKEGKIYLADSEYAMRAYVYHRRITVKKFADVTLFRNNLKKIAGGVYEIL